ncbi:MAG TPA: PhnD/SsuA/transferrin family substrate-binding protein [Myxococcales bacterium]|nr:PhnD/SsuA/transferrin family substrate-binding protein [Myxococcales bacterium]
MHLVVFAAALKLAISSPLGAEQAQKDAAGLSQLLTQLLKQEVTAEVVPHGDLPAMLAEGRADLAWCSAGQYVDASARARVEPAAKLVRGGMPFYRSALFARKQVKRLADLRGRRLAFVSEQSSAGYVLPRQILLGAGFTEADLRGVKFLGDHAAVCKAVLSGEAAGGATFANDGRGGPLAGCAETVGPDAVKQLHVLATSDPIPNDVVAVRPGAPADLLPAVRSALLSLSQSSDGRRKLEQLFHADAFVPADDADYAPLRASRLSSSALH